MRPIDADELLEHVEEDKLYSQKLISQMIKDAPTAVKGALTWIRPKYIPFTSEQHDLFLSYREGWPLWVVYFRDGEGWRRIDNDKPVNPEPELVAHINLPC